MDHGICSSCFQKTDIHPCPFCGYDPALDAGKYPLALKPGSILNGRYILGRILGQGGFGITYLAWEVNLRQKVAIKEFFPETMVTRMGSHQVSVYTGQLQDNFSYGLECFLSEARTMAEFLGVPTIVQVYRYFEENGTAYFVMEYVDGVSLQEHLNRKGGRLSWQETADILLPVMDALSIVHEKGIIHRDIAPDNIYLTRDGGIKLLDFGSARYSLGDKSRSLDVILKHGYAPMEQYTRRGKQGPYTDVYALAATFYRCLTGQIPQEAADRMEEDKLFLSICWEEYLPAEAADALKKALSLRAAGRFQTIAPFREALLATLVQASPEPELPQEEPSEERPLEAELPEEEFPDVEPPEEGPLETVLPEEEVPETEPEEPPETEPLHEEPAVQEPEEEDCQAEMPKAERQTKTRWFPAIAGAAAVLALAGVFLLLQPEKQNESIQTAVTAPTLPVQTESPAETLAQLQPAETMPLELVLKGNPLQTLAADRFTALAIQEDGTLVAANAPQMPGMKAPPDWQDLVKVDLSVHSTYTNQDDTTTQILQAVGLKADGSVVAASYDRDDPGYWEPTGWDFSGWTDIVDVGIGVDYAAGLKADGTVVTAGPGRPEACSHWQNIVAIDVTQEDIVGIRSDGSVVGTGKNWQWKNLSSWKNITALSCSSGYHILSETILGLRSDGTVAAEGNNEFGECDVADWRDITAITSHSGTTVGLKKDGTVVCCGYQRQDEHTKLPGWTDITEVEIFKYGGHWGILGLRSDGTVESTVKNVYDWTDIVSIKDCFGRTSDGRVLPIAKSGASGETNVYHWQDIVDIAADAFYGFTVGLKADGSVIAAGRNTSGRTEVSDWQDITAIAIGNAHTVGLKSDGTVVATGTNEHDQCDVSHWTDICKIYAHPEMTVGLRTDGTVAASGEWNSLVGHWTEITDILLCSGRIVGLKADGTVVSAGLEEDLNDMDTWTDIVAVSGGLGLRTDGTVVAAGYTGYDVSSWKDIVAVSDGGYLAVGLKADGTVVAAGGDHSDASQVAQWEDITAVHCSGNSVYGLHADGTVLRADSATFTNLNWVPDVSHWTNIHQPQQRN